MSRSGNRDSGLSVRGRRDTIPSAQGSDDQTEASSNDASFANRTVSTNANAISSIPSAHPSVSSECNHHRQTNHQSISRSIRFHHSELPPIYTRSTSCRIQTHEGCRHIPSGPLDRPATRHLSVNDILSDSRGVVTLDTVLPSGARRQDSPSPAAVQPSASAVSFDGTSEHHFNDISPSELQHRSVKDKGKRRRRPSASSLRVEQGSDYSSSDFQTEQEEARFIRDTVHPLFRTPQQLETVRKVTERREFDLRNAVMKGFVARDLRTKDEGSTWSQRQKRITQKFDDMLAAMEAVNLQDRKSVHSLEHQAAKLEREERVREMQEEDEDKKAEQELRAFEANCDFKLVLKPRGQLDPRGQLECVGGRWATQDEDLGLEVPPPSAPPRIVMGTSGSSFLMTRKPKYKDHNWMEERGHTRGTWQRRQEALNARETPGNSAQHGADGW